MAEAIDIRELNERIEKQSAFVTNLITGMDQVIVGQKHLVESLLIGLLSDGHVLLEGSTRFSEDVGHKDFGIVDRWKIQSSTVYPDLLPADVIGTMMYSQKDETFIAQRGPIFCQFRVGGRNQPCSGQGAECFVGSDAGTSGHHQ